MQQYNFKKNFVDFRKNLSLTEQDRQTLISANFPLMILNIGRHL